LKLAWAITIHKSQGLTFERAIIDAGLAFAHGQVYVALSRCKSLQGMVLRSPLSDHSIKTDGTVSEYSRRENSKPLGEDELLASRIDFQRVLLFELFDFSPIQRHLARITKIVQDHHLSLDAQLHEQIENTRMEFDKAVLRVSESF